MSFLHFFVVMCSVFFFFFFFFHFQTVQLVRVNDPFSLQDYLSKPFSRMCKYRQFLEGLQKDMPQANVATGPLKAQEGEIAQALWVIKFHLRHGNDLLALEKLRQFDVGLLDPFLID